MGSVICEEKRAPVASLLSSINLRSDGRADTTRDVARHAFIKAALGQLNVLYVNVDGRYSMPLHLERGCRCRTVHPLPRYSRCAQYAAHPARQALLLLP